ncbi:preprotein translocase subunit SecE [Neisseria sp. 23W00296]|uniref:preprotein translocase subunit SecE n=1 Tax=unclassified Neisseria TaxID=2623750 RepID=UPI003757AF06
MNKQDIGKRAESVSVLMDPKLQKQVRKSMARFLIKLALIMLLSVGVWFALGQTTSVPGYIQNLLIAFAIFAGIVIVMWGNFSRFVRYVKDSVVELRKVVWPEKAYTIKMTGFVLVFAGVLTVFIYVVDSVISWVLFDLLMR